MTSAPATRGRARRGTALVDALLAAVLGALVLAAALSVAVRVARASHEHDARAAARAQLEQAAGALTADLRPITAAADGADPSDLRALADTAVELTATVGGGVACAVTSVSSTGSIVELASVPDVPSAPTLVWWNTPPRTGDVAFFHDDAGTPSPADDRWTLRTVRTVSEGTTYCRSGPFATATAAGTGPGALRVRLALDPPVLPSTVGAGAPVRVGRHRRYSLYRAPDGWQLGLREWDGSAWDGIQPAAGPFDTPGRRGLQLDAVDTSGTPVQGTPPQRVAAEIRVLLRAPCSARDPRLRCIDSTVAVIRPRGNR
ncbi:hypothetical protein tb265_05480 [Gemmatimonadetes bacterium T265]|nr:hypothetical protein tb265_05480 [Gemmatimonadetes bacterium T265]